MERIRIVGLGGTLRPHSSSEKALALCLGFARDAGAETEMFSGSDLDLPTYSPERAERSLAAERLVRALRSADGIVISSPGYHGALSGMIKNALDYTEDMRDDPRPYFDGCAVGCIASAYGWQATASTLTSLRFIVHALRGWPTPLGAAINAKVTPFDAEGNCSDPGVCFQLETIAHQVVDFARMSRETHRSSNVRRIAAE